MVTSRAPDGAEKYLVGFSNLLPRIGLGNLTKKYLVVCQMRVSLQKDIQLRHFHLFVQTKESKNASILVFLTA